MFRLPTLPYTWFVEIYDTSNPFNGTIDIYLDDSNGPLLFEGTIGQTNQTFLLNLLFMAKIIQMLKIIILMQI